jgi:hypothetical protein
MRNVVTLPDGREVWPKYPLWRKFGLKKRPNRSRRHRGKMRLRYNSLYATDCVFTAVVRKRVFNQRIAGQQLEGFEK